MLTIVIGFSAEAAIGQDALSSSDALNNSQTQNSQIQNSQTQDRLVRNLGTDAIYMEETVITGNQELPKVLYILPWREMASEPLPERSLNFASQSLLVPVYPDEQKRQLAFRKALDTARKQQEASQKAAKPSK